MTEELPRPKRPEAKKRGVKFRKCCNTKHASSEVCPLFLRNRYIPQADGSTKVMKVWAK